MRQFCELWRGLGGDRRGAISIIGAFVLVGVVGVSALALEYGHGLLQKTENQRVADLAAYGGALVYGSTSSSSSATSAASNIATLNGASGTVTPTYVSSPTGDGNHAVEVVVTTNLPLVLARVLTTNTTVPVTATAYAEIKSNHPGCIIALSGGGTGVTMSGGTSITANNCAVDSDNSLTLSGGAALVSQTVDYAKTAPSVSGGASITAPAGKTLQENRVTTTDPLSPSSGSTGSTEVTSATARLSTVASISSPTSPNPTPTVPSGGAVSFKTTGVTGLPSGCIYTYASSVYTVTCSGTATFGTITVTSVTVVINTSSGNTYNFDQAWPISGVRLSGSGGTYGFGAGLTTSGGTYPAGTYNVVGPINASGTTFGAGTYNVTAGIITAGTTTFGAGNFNLGVDTSTGCAKNAPADESICNSGTLAIAGPSTFNLAGGIYNSGGSTLTLGSGSTSNSYNIGADGSGDSINAGTSASVTLDDATGTGDLFQTAGSITNGGGNCLWIPAAAEHDINGSISLSGGTTLGSGVYTVSGYFAAGDNNGGDVTCGGNPVGVSGSNVTFVIGASTTPSGQKSNCAGLAFCVAAGFGNVTLTAPTSGSTEDLLVIGPTSTTNTAGAAFTQGSSGTTLTGAFYLPNGQVTMSGSGTISSGGGCLELVASQITLSGGSAAASTCTGLGGGSLGTAVTMVQ